MQLCILIFQFVYPHQNVIGKRNNRKYWDFLLHNTIIYKEESKDNIKTYELSLFGVILALTLIRYNDMDKLKHGLYYNNISFIEYYEKIVANYKDKLPLIFGKWKVLKDILRLYAAYNFDVIIDDIFIIHRIINFDWDQGDSYVSKQHILRLD
jgi:hypothetical protein